MHLTPFLVLSSVAASVAAHVANAGHGVSYAQHRRHHAQAREAALVGRKVTPSRKRCRIQSSSALTQLSSSSSIASSPSSIISVLSTDTVDASSTSLPPPPITLSTSSTPASIPTASPSSSSSATIVTTSMQTSSSKSTSSSASTASSTSPASGGGGGGEGGGGGGGNLSLHSKLFPVQTLSSWTTAKELSNALPLSDGTLTPTDNIKALTHTFMPMAGKIAMQAQYPAGSWNLQNTPRGGFSFYANGPKQLDLSSAREVLFSYSVYFPPGFDFVMGGKIPGIYGGDTAAGAVGCSGGSRNDKCFSARMMWRTGGAGEMYTYLPPGAPANDRVCDVPPYSECNPTYGASVARGSFTFKTGGWTTVAMRARLNDVGQEDGELQLWADGESMFSIGGLVLRTSDSARIWGMQMQTFFGGSTNEWATPKDQEVYFADFSMGILDTF